MKTETLIRVLAADATRPVIGIRSLTWGALAAGAAASVALFALALAPRADLPAAFHDFNVLVKLAVTVSLALTAAWSLDAVARPLRREKRLRILALAPMLLTLAVLTQLASSPAASWLALLVGRNAGRCVAVIPLLSALPACCVMLALKRGAPANPALAGAVAGLAAGGLGASLYAVFCPIDNPLFVATWYSLAVGLVTLACACLGRRWLRW
jgi:hypothetical protein